MSEQDNITGKRIKEAKKMEREELSNIIGMDIK
jgi:hypothetical protein